jgi:protein-tyrosine-phosphatase
MKQRVLFIGTNNAARTQMAEGYLRARYGDRYEACSAGTAPTALDPLAITRFSQYQNRTNQFTRHTSCYRPGGGVGFRMISFLPLSYHKHRAQN